MPDTTNPARFVLYARKSTESEDRQVQSLDDQIALANKMAGEQGFVIVHSIAEAHSAKTQGTRSGFKEMVDWINRGKADGIVCWHPDRLARNAVDGGWILDLLDRGKLKHLVFSSGYHFDNTPESKFMLGMVFSQAKYQVDKLSKDVTRGMVSKRERGGFPHRAPEGWKNIRVEATGEKTIFVDTERFTLLRQAIDLILSDAQVPAQALQTLNNEWGYRTRQTKERAGGPLPYASFYGLLCNPFIKGMCRHAGGLYQGCHKPMVTPDEFGRLQAILMRREKHRTRTRQAATTFLVRTGRIPSRANQAEVNAFVSEQASSTTFNRHDFAFTGLLRCEQCGHGMITATCAKGHIYYHCTNAKKNCTRRGVREETIAEEITHHLDRVYVPEDVGQQLLVMTKRHLTEQDIVGEERQLVAQARFEEVLSKMQSQQQKLRGLLLRDVLTEADYLSEKARLDHEAQSLQEQLSVHTSLEAETERVMQAAGEVIAFVTTAPIAFSTALSAEKRQIVRYLSGFDRPEAERHPRPRLDVRKVSQTGQNVLLKPHPHLVPFIKHLALYRRVEPRESGSDKQKRPYVYRSVLLGAPDETLIKLSADLCQQIQEYHNSSSSFLASCIPAPPHTVEDSSSYTEFYN